MGRKILVTGADGYIGQKLGEVLSHSEYRATGTVRRTKPSNNYSGYETLIATGDINGQTPWSAALQGIDCVVHLAGSAHKYGQKHL
mgnify:FL=1